MSTATARRNSWSSPRRISTPRRGRPTNSWRRARRRSTQPDRDTPLLLRLVEGEGHGGWREESTRGVLADEVAFLWHLVQGPARSPDMCEVGRSDARRRAALRQCLAAGAHRESAAVLLRTPYANDANEFARWGLQDYLHRGNRRGDSEAFADAAIRKANFGFFLVEGKDGYDSIDGSRIRAVRWQAAMDGGLPRHGAMASGARTAAHLVCIMPSVPAGDWFNEIPFIGGALQSRLGFLLARAHGGPDIRF